MDVSTTDDPRRWHKIRRFPRFRADLRVVVTALGDPHPVYGRAGSIAEGGFGATLAGELAVGSPVAADLVLDHNTDGHLRAEAVVRYRHGFRHGFQFLDLPSETRSTLREFCSALPPDE